MTQSTKDQIQGTLYQAAGIVKEKVGQVLKSPDLTAEGQNEKVAGIVQKKLGQVEKVFEK